MPPKKKKPAQSRKSPSRTKSKSRGPKPSDFIEGAKTLAHGDSTWKVEKLLVHPPGKVKQGDLFPGYNPFHGVSPKDVYFDTATAQRALDFFQFVLTLVEGDKAGLPFILEEWQARIVANLFGWKRRSDGRRRYRQLFLYVPRKNGKTPLVAGIVLFCLFCDREPGAQIYSAASDIDQAAVIFHHAAYMVYGNPALDNISRVYRSLKSIELQGTGTRMIYKALSSKASGTHGKNIHVGVIEELHTHDSPDLTEGIETGHGSRKQPITIYVTTADFNRPSVCNARLRLAKAVRDDLEHTKRETLLPIIYETPRIMDGKEVDWKSDEVRRAVNPNFGVSVEPTFLDDELAKAVEVQDFENTYKRLYLNMTTESSTRWLNMSHWDSAPYLNYDLSKSTESSSKSSAYIGGEKNYPPSPHYDLELHKSLPSLGRFTQAGEIPKISDPVSWRLSHVPPREILSPHNWEELQQWLKTHVSWLVNPERTWFGGIDLSSNIDITALCLFSPQKNPWTGAYPVIPFFWLPGDTAEKRERSTGLPYPTWVRNGFLWETQGEFIDLDPVCSNIAGICEIFNVQGLAFDRWGDRDAYNRLTGHGIRCERYPQSYAGMSEPCRTLVRLLGHGLLEHGGNPVLQWMAGNVVKTENRDGQIRPDKESSGEKIDGIVALLMAIGFSLNESPSVYNTRGVLSLGEDSPKPYDALKVFDPFDPETWGEHDGDEDVRKLLEFNQTLGPPTAPPPLPEEEPVYVR